MKNCRNTLASDAYFPYCSSTYWYALKRVIFHEVVNFRLEYRKRSEKLYQKLVRINFIGETLLVLGFASDRNTYFCWDGWSVHDPQIYYFCDNRIFLDFQSCALKSQFLRKLILNNLFMKKTFVRFLISWFDRLKIVNIQSQVFFSQTNIDSKNSEKIHIFL